MGEGQPLLALGVVPDSIWGDEDETIAYAQVLGKGRAVIFRFYLDPNHPPQALPTRIVNSFHDIEVANDKFTFQDRSDMRRAVWSTIAMVWPSCIVEPTVFEPGTVVDLIPDDDGEVLWKAYREPLFDRYLDLLRSIQPNDLVPHDYSAPILDISQVAILEPMGGKGCCKRVQVHQEPGAPSTLAFKGIDFQTYLQVHDDDDEYAYAMVD